MTNTKRNELRHQLSAAEAFLRGQEAAAESGRICRAMAVEASDRHVAEARAAVVAILNEMNA